jgi:hypothetical protein
MALRYQTKDPLLIFVIKVTNCHEYLWLSIQVKELHNVIQKVTFPEFCLSFVKTN